MQVEAFAEAMVLHIHPFADFNGRAVRVLALELVRRFDLPVIRSWVHLGHLKAPPIKRLSWRLTFTGLSSR